MPNPAPATKNEKSRSQRGRHFHFRYREQELVLRREQVHPQPQRRGSVAISGKSNRSAKRGGRNPAPVTKKMRRSPLGGRCLFVWADFKLRGSRGKPRRPDAQHRIKAPRLTEPQRGEGHPAPATGKTKAENLINVLHRSVEITTRSGHKEFPSGAPISTLNW